MVDMMKTRVGSGVVAIASIYRNKASLVVGVTADLAGRISAVSLVRDVAQAFGGNSGGGKPDLAQTGGAHPEKAEQTLQLIASALRDMQP